MKTLWYKGNMKLKHLFALLGLVVIVAGCTENTRSRAWGGKMNVSLPSGVKLVNITWKNSDMWYLTRQMTSNDVAETYSFQEKSRFGMLEGTITIHESK